MPTSNPTTPPSASTALRSLTAFGPDFPFSFDHWVADDDGVGIIPADNRGAEVAIVGAGIAGLVTAYELMRLGLRPVIYEAGRLGGRLRSERFGAAPHVMAELGGMRFPVTGKALFHYIDLCRLETRPFPNPLTEAAGSTVIDLAGTSHYARTIHDLPPLFREVSDAWEASLENEARLGELQQAMIDRDPARVHELWDPLVESWDDRTFYDFIATAEPFCNLGYRHREVFGQVGFGTGGWDSDFPNTMLEILRVAASGFDDNQRFIVVGAEQLPRRLWEHKPRRLAHWATGTSLARLHKGAPRPGVARLARNENGTIAITDRWGVIRNYQAVVVTTQSWLLTTGIEVDETLLSHKVWMALDRTSYMQSSKTFVMVDRPFWDDINPVTGRHVMSMTLTDRNTRGTYLLDNGPNKPAVILLAYAWNSDAMKVLPMSAQERARLAIDTLQKIYPDVDLRSHIIGEPMTVSWESDPLFLGAFKRGLPGHYRYSRRMHSHFLQTDFPADHRGIYLAGDDVGWTPGWAEGAVHTALNAVWGVMTQFGGAAHDGRPGPGDVYADVGPVLLPDD